MSDEQRDEIISQLAIRSFSDPLCDAPTSVMTKSGDEGMTQLLFEREVTKWDPRIKLVGQLDTMNSFLNLYKAGVLDEKKQVLGRVQDALVYVMAEVATHEDDIERYKEFYHSISDSDVLLLEKLTKKLENQGASFASWVEDLEIHCAYADTARTFTRQAESMTWELVSQDKVRALLAQWLNRLSDLLWALSRKK